MKNIQIGLLSAGLMLSGCSVMHFKNGPTQSSGLVREAWHHNAVYSLMEVSQPVDLKTLCEGKGWARVTTQETFITGLVGSVDNTITSVFLPPGGIDIWDPQFIQWSCKDGSGSSSESAPAVPADTSATPTPTP